MAQEQLTRNIWRYEIACKCGCGLDSIDFETIVVLQECCNHFAKELNLSKVVLRIYSGCRCELHNEHIKGSKNSFHTKCRAIDFTIDRIDPRLVYEYLNDKYSTKYGLGNYSSFTHLDTRTGGPARW